MNSMTPFLRRHLLQVKDSEAIAKCLQPYQVSNMAQIYAAIGFLAGIKGNLRNAIKYKEHIGNLRRALERAESHYS